MDRYLWDTQFEYPQVYFQYLEVKKSLALIQNEIQPGLYSCIAIAADWENHTGGHVGYGNDPYAAKRNALKECNRYHNWCQISSCH